MSCRDRAILLCTRGGMSVAEIAEALGVTPRAVRKGLVRIRDRAEAERARVRIAEDSPWSS